MSGSRRDTATGVGRGEGVLRPIRCAVWLVLAALGALAGCATEEPDPEVEAPDTALSRASTPETTPRTEPSRRAQPPLPASMQRATRTVTFPHDPHVEIDCATCHTSVPGHRSHAAVACRECHQNGTAPPPVPPATEVCLACHHREEEPRPCAYCHVPVAPLVTEHSVHLGVWTEARLRELPFEHARHATSECATCHLTRPRLETSLRCGACHENHHRADAACLACHAEPREGAHGLESHLGCAGAGCHSDPVVEALPPRRPLCLVCHQDQIEHNPGRDCADCHQVRGPPGSVDPALATPPARLPASGHPW